LYRQPTKNSRRRDKKRGNCPGKQAEGSQYGSWSLLFSLLTFFGKLTRYIIVATVTAGKME
jgi:membrane protein YqaA with SNARE-associated domain